jgi:hypothetical protein
LVVSKDEHGELDAGSFRAILEHLVLVDVFGPLQVADLLSLTAAKFGSR